MNIKYRDSSIKPLERIQDSIDAQFNQCSLACIAPEDYNLNTIQALIDKIKELEKDLNTADRVGEIHVKSVTSLQNALDESQAKNKDLVLSTNNIAYNAGKFVNKLQDEIKLKDIKIKELEDEIWHFKNP